MDIATKLDTITLLAQTFRENHIEWALGGSTLLYLKGIVKELNDIDIMIKEQDADRIEKLIEQSTNCKIGINVDSDKFSYHASCRINDVPIELFDGMKFKDGGEDKKINFSSFCVHECVMLGDEVIPLMGCRDWCRRYLALGNLDKAEQIYKMNHLW